MGINSIDNQYYNAFLPAKQAATSSVDNPIKEELQISFGDTKNIESDVFEKEENAPADGKDDGSIGFWGTLKSFGKGALNFFKGMVCDENGKFSLKQTLKTAGMIAGIGLLTLVPVIGPLVLPALCIYGIYEGGKIAYEGAQKAYNATTDAEAEQAWEEIGTGATEGILSVAGYKATGGIKAAFGKSKAQFMSIKNRFSKAQDTPVKSPVELTEKTSTSEAASSENTTATRTPEEVAEIYERTKKQIEESRPKVSAQELDNKIAVRKKGLEALRRILQLEEKVGEETHLSFAEHKANVEKCRKHISQIDGICLDTGIEGAHYSELYAELVDIITRRKIEIPQRFKGALKRKDALSNYNIDGIIVESYDTNTVTLKLPLEKNGVTTYAKGILKLDKINNKHVLTVEENGTSKVLSLKDGEVKPLKSAISDSSKMIESLKKRIKGNPDITDASVGNDGTITIKFNLDDHGFKVPQMLEIKPVKHHGNLTEYQQKLNGEFINPKTTVPKEELDVIMKAIENSSRENRLITLKKSPEEINGLHIYTIKYNNNYYLISCPNAQLATVHPITRSGVRNLGIDLNKVPSLETQQIYSYLKKGNKI